MELKFWIWLIIVVAYYLIQRMRKAPAPGEPANFPSREERREEVPADKPLTFEELMREIEQAQGKQEQPAPPTPPRRDYVDYDDEVKAEETVVPAASDGTSLEIYEKAKKEAFERPSLEETMKVEDTVVKFDHFKGYEGVEDRATHPDFLKDLRDPEGFRKAFILSEILKRKF